MKYWNVVGGDDGGARAGRAHTRLGGMGVGA